MQWPTVSPQPLTPAIRWLDHLTPPVAPPNHTWVDPIGVQLPADECGDDATLAEALRRAFADFWVAGVLDLGNIRGERVLIVSRATPDNDTGPTLH